MFNECTEERRPVPWHHLDPPPARKPIALGRDVRWNHGVYMHRLEAQGLEWLRCLDFRSTLREGSGYCDREGASATTLGDGRG